MLPLALGMQRFVVAVSAHRTFINLVHEAVGMTLYYIVGLVDPRSGF